MHARCAGRFWAVPDLAKVAEGLDRSALLEIIRIQTDIVKMSFDLGEVMAAIAERAMQLTHATGAVIELVDGEELVYRAATGSAAPHLGLRLQRSGSLSGFCVAEGQAQICMDSESDPRVDREASRKVGLRSMVVVPLKHAERTVGVLKVLAASPAAFTTTHMQILHILSGIIGAAMYHAAHNESTELAFKATHDELTELANRSLFFDRLRQKLAEAAETKASLGVLNLDMDGLKAINDGLGHRAGDAAIREFARRLKSAARATDTAARIGGDEFGVLLFPLADRSEAEQQRARIAEFLQGGFEHEGRPLRIAGSVGLAVFPEHGNDVQGLWEAADQEMYRAKQARKALSR